MAGALLTRYRQMSRHGVRRAARLHQYIPLMLLAHVLLAGSFVWIYTRGREPGKPWMGQGVRFGIAVALLTVVPTYMIYFVRAADAGRARAQAGTLRWSATDTARNHCRVVVPRTGWLTAPSPVSAARRGAAEWNGAVCLIRQTSA